VKPPGEGCREEDPNKGCRGEGEEQPAAKTVARFQGSRRPRRLRRVRRRRSDSWQNAEGKRSVAQRWWNPCLKSETWGHPLYAQNDELK